jgi:hypothetical protein
MTVETIMDASVSGVVSLGAVIARPIKSTPIEVDADFDTERSGIMGFETTRGYFNSCIARVESQRSESRWTRCPAEQVESEPETPGENEHGKSK